MSSKEITGDLPVALYRGAQVRELDRLAIDLHGIPGSVLMERAGRRSLAALSQRWPAARRIGVVCGVGNNAGDGFVLARWARRAGRTVNVYQVGDGSRLAGEALAAWEGMEHAGVSRTPWPASGPEGNLEDNDVLVDALLGTGLSRDVSGDFARAIEAMNGSGRPVLALDVPSGLDADRGVVHGLAVRADLTVTFIGLKQGLFTADGPEHAGPVQFDDLGVPGGIYDSVPASASLMDFEVCRGWLGPRHRNAHKGRFGHVLVVGGDEGYAGAVRLAAEAALRVGAGLVSIATRPAHAASLVGQRPELMCRGVSDPAELGPLLSRATLVVLGPGLGLSAWSRAMLGRVLESEHPLVVDADGLNLLAEAGPRRRDWVLTPHPGEAARLLGSTTRAIQTDRFSAAGSLVRTWGGVCVLKGAGTVLARGGPTGDEHEVALCRGGNPGMASGGMGDVLSGVVGGLLAQGLEPWKAARLGVCLHGWAGDRAAEAGERGLLAMDLMPFLRQGVN